MEKTAMIPADRVYSRGEALTFLQNHDHYLLLSHAHPDGDTLGAGRGLELLLRRMGKEAYQVCETVVSDRLAFLTGGRTDLRLEALPKDFVPETIVSVDVAAPGLLGAYEEKFGQDMHIDLALDHHGTHTPFAKKICLDASLCACAELIFDLAVLAFDYSMERPLPSEMALPLYAGISTDGGSFQYSSVSPKTMMRAAVLMASGIKHYEICAALYENMPLSEVRARQAAYNHMTLHFGDSVGFVLFTPEMMEQYQLRDEDLDGVVNLLRRIEGVKIAVHAKWRGENLYKISLRSEVGYDVSEVCKEFGGGGHCCAAGCALSGTAESVQKTILDAIEKIL